MKIDWRMAVRFFGFNLGCILFGVGIGLAALKHGPVVLIVGGLIGLAVVSVLASRKPS